MKKITLFASLVVAATLFSFNMGHITTMKKFMENMSGQIEALTASPEYKHHMKPKITLYTAQTYSASYSNGVKYGEYSSDDNITATITNIQSPYVYIYYDCVGAIFNYKVCDINRVGWQNPNNYVN